MHAKPLETDTDYPSRLIDLTAVVTSLPA